MVINFWNFVNEWLGSSFRQKSNTPLKVPWERGLTIDAIQGGRKGSGVQIDSNPVAWPAELLHSHLFIIHHSTAVRWRKLCPCNKPGGDIFERHWWNQSGPPLCCRKSQVRAELIKIGKTDGADSWASGYCTSYYTESCPATMFKRRLADWATVRSNLNCQIRRLPCGEFQKWYTGFALTWSNLNCCPHEPEGQNCSECIHLKQIEDSSKTPEDEHTSQQERMRSSLRYPSYIYGVK